MKVEHINPIYTASRDVFKKMFGWDVEKRNLQIVEEIETKNTTNVSIGITGDLKGTIMFSFPEGIVLKIVEEMSGMKFEKVDKFVASAIGELANIISGNAMNGFSGNNYECDIVPPQISLGESTTFATTTDKALLINMNTQGYMFDLFISITEPN
ncbi:MAG: chemotaxis protein CheX [Thermotogota bacterium]